MAVLVLGLVGLSGLVVGSYVRGVVDEVSRGRCCPACGAPEIGWSWLVRSVRVRCAACRAWTGAALVEVGLAVVFVVLSARLAELGQLAAAPTFLFFAALGLALALIDAQTHRLPDRLVLPSYPVLAGLLAVAAGVRADWWSFARALIGGAVLFALFLLVVLAYPAGLGFGDVKLAGLVGAVLAYLSWSALVAGVFAGFLLAAVAGVVLLATGKASGSTRIPFGPYLVLGALVGVFTAGPAAG